MIFDLPLAVSANRLVRPAMMGKTARLVKTKAGQKWNVAARAALARRPDLYVRSGPIHLTVKLYVRTISSDLSNRIKALEDVLTGVVWHDDSQVTCLTVRKFLGRANAEPFMRVQVEPDLDCPPDFAARLAKSKTAGAKRVARPSATKLGPELRRDSRGFVYATSYYR